MDDSSAIIDRLVALHPKKIDLSLDRMLRLLARLGHPERRLPPTIHVTGTNGKGSTVAYLRAMLEAAGKRVHVYTSPHLVRFHERVRLAGKLVPEAMLADALIECERVNEGEPITIFEITTAAAVLLFARHPAEVLLLEVGLGGRLDATNVIDRPLASVVTPVSMDHAAYLGDTLALIAGEKAGILKAGAPAIVARQADEARRVIEAAAARVGAPLFVSGQDWQAREERGRLVYEDAAGLLDLPLPRLAGRHQYENAGAAIATLRRIWPDFPSAAIEKGLGTVEWPARMQALTHGPLVEAAPPGAELWLDGGHNPAAGEVLAAAFAELEERGPRPLWLVSGMLTSKDATGFFRPFQGIARGVVTVPIPDVEAAFDPAALAKEARAAGLKARVSDGLVDALRGLPAGPPPPRILICGSLYLAGHALSLQHALPD